MEAIGTVQYTFTANCEGMQPVTGTSIGDTTTALAAKRTFDTTPVIPKTRFVIQPTTSGSGYVANDQVGGLITITNAVLLDGGFGKIVHATITNTVNNIRPTLWLHLFSEDPEETSSDSASITIPDANLRGGNYLGSIWLATGNQIDMAGGTNSVGAEERLAQPIKAAAGSTSIYGLLQSAGTYSIADESLEITLTIEQV